MRSLWHRLDHPCAIRLLQFPHRGQHPADALQNLKLVTIHPDDLKDVAYQALSYTWGEELAQHTITVNGVDVRVRSNLWQFLSRVSSRKEMNVEYLWIDALCISQTDLDEKAAQVQRIGDIFSAAYRVVVWLGIDEGEPQTGTDTKASHWQHEESFNRACNAPYWARTWIVQEILLAQDLLFCFGEHTFDRGHFQQLFDLNYLGLYTLNLPGYALEMCKTILSDKGRRQDDNVFIRCHTPSSYQSSLTDLVVGFAESQCSVTLDKIYALLSLVDWHGRTPIQVDYTIDEAELYLRAISSAKNIQFHHSENIRNLLTISPRQIVARSSEIFVDESSSQLEVDSGFQYSAEYVLDESWDISHLPHLRRESEKWFYCLHSGDVKIDDILVKFSHTRVFLVLRRSGREDKYIINGLAFSHCDGETLPIKPCVENCIDVLGTVKWQFDEPPGQEPKDVYISLQIRAWLSLCWHEWSQKDEISLLTDNTNGEFYLS